MADIVAVLTPTAINVDDYPIAQAPSLGSEKEVSLTSKLARVLGIIFLNDDATVKYTYINKPTTGGGPIVCFVQGELKSDSSPVITFGDLTGTFTPAEWARNKSFNFAASRAVELTGPGVTVISETTVPTITNAKRGGSLILMQLPTLTDFNLVGATTSADIDIPSATGKNIAEGLNSSRWSKRGKTSEGKLKISGYDYGEDDGLNRFRGVTCVAMIETKKDGSVLTCRQFATNYIPGGKQTNPVGDSETVLDAEGTYQSLITLVAP